MKGLAVLQLISMVLVDRMNIPFEKDIHFLALADEEEGSSGAIGVIREMAKGKSLHSLTNASVMLSESGGALNGLNNMKSNLINELYFSDMSINLIGVEEKGIAWLKLKETSYRRLFDSLYKMRVLDIKKKIKSIKKYKEIRKKKCMLMEANTPDSKVNVVASKINFKLFCFSSGDVESLLKDAFINDFQDVTFQSIKHENGIFEINLATSSSSHGSVGLSQSVLEVFATGLHRIGTIKIKKNRGFKPSFFKELTTDTVEAFISKN